MVKEYADEKEKNIKILVFKILIKSNK